MLDANALHISLALEGVSTDLQVLSFVGREALNQPFRFDIELVSHRPDLELEALLHKPGSLTFGAAGTGIIHGLVYRIEQGDSGKQLTRYSISLVPQLAYLRHNHDQQIFQDLTVPEIIALVLEARGILADAYSFQLGATYPKHDYCVQYDESDLHFIQRLCEEEGIHFHFQHSNSGHKLVFGDDQTVFRKLAAVRYQQNSGMAAEQPVIKRFGPRLETRTTRGGGSFLKLDPSGVTLSGANIKINSGGAPGKGSGIQILGPVTPEAADADKPGSTLQQALFIPHQLGTSSSAIDTVIQKDLHSLPAGAATAQAIPSPLVQTGSLSFVPAAQSDSGPGKWVTQKIDYDGISNTLTMFTNRLGSLGDEGRVFGSERKDYQHTTRRMIQEWMPLDESEQHLAVNSAINIYGQRREIAQRYLEGDDNWQLSGRSLHWQPVTASTVYEQKDKQQ